MKVLVLGSQGMLGHVVAQVLEDKGHEVIRHTREMFDIYNEILVDGMSCDCVVNCIGLLVRESEKYKDRAIHINAEFPHIMNKWCEENKKKFIHISTDCVFSGRHGSYSVIDKPDATTFYGKTKALGEVTGDNTLTIRTSIIGPELKKGTGLFHWLLTEEADEVKGYLGHYWNGVTTLELAHLIERELTSDHKGIWQYSGATISKYEVLETINDVFAVNKEIEAIDCPKIDKSLRNSYSYNPPFLVTMLQDLRYFMESHKEDYVKQYGHSWLGGKE